MGLGLAVAPSMLMSCKKDEALQVNFNGKVLIIGAGSAGLMAGYMLQRYNIDFEIIEASSVFGGRVKKLDGFADFPIDLGAEWIHEQPDIFGRMIDDESAQGSVDLIPYNPETISLWSDSGLTNVNVGNPFYGEFKFKRSTWFDFFDQHIVPHFSDKIRYNSPVNEINYSGDKVLVSTTDGTTYEGDKVLVTVPTAILKSGSITFTPALPTNKINALSQMYMPPGIKVFIEFAERFYPDIMLVNRDTGAESDEKIYIDAAFKKDSPRHVMGLFNVGPSAGRLTDLSSDQEIIDAVLAELDEAFDGKASQHYLAHVVQNWSTEPFIQGSYTYGGGTSEMDALRDPIQQKVYFAGEALHAEANSTVHGAGLSANEVTRTILSGE